MPCHTFKHKDGAVVIACTRGRATNKRCPICHRHSVAKLCDYPLTGAKSGQTCDRPMCVHCAVPVGENKDYCPAHARLARKRGEL